MKKGIFLILGFIIFIFSCKSFLETTIDKTKDSFEIRVLLKYATQNVVLTGDFIVKDFITKKEINIKNKKNIIICAKNNKIFLNEINILSPILIISKNNGLIKLNDRYYSGYLKINPDNGNFYIINYIPLETYLISVLPSEVPVSFNIEAMKAQAVVARTYAYYFIKKANDKEFDVDDTFFYQVYNGFNPQFKREIVKKIYKAIKGTEGIIIKYENEPIIAYFHSNSGGITTSGKDYFGPNSDFPYLISQKDPYSIDMPGYKWEFEILIKDFCKILNINNTSCIISDNFLYNKNGFVDKFTKGELSFGPKDIRRLIGYSKIKSEKFTVDIKEDKIYFTGYGYGHGVGLSQWGAENMARKKKKFRDIIKFYYPKTKIESF